MREFGNATLWVTDEEALLMVWAIAERSTRAPWPGEIAISVPPYFVNVAMEPCPKKCKGKVCRS